LCINSLNNPKIYQYWNYAQHFLKEKSSLTVNEAEEELAYLLQDAAHIRTRMDVPYCALLSGGMDSTAVTLALSKECSNLHSYTVKFSQKNFDESGEALRIANLLDIKANIVREDVDILLGYKKMIDYIDEPFADSSYLPCASIFSSISEHYKVCFTGDGGDEIFAGYDTYTADLINRYLRYIPKQALRLMLTVSKSFIKPSYGKVGIDEKLGRLLQGANKDPLFSHYSWRLINSNHDIKNLFNAEYHPLIDQYDPFKDFKIFYEDVKDADLIDSMLYVDAKTWLVDDVLYKVDRSSMMHSLEVRSPLLDYRIAEFMANLPVAFKLNLRYKKILLRKFLANNIPESYIQKKKQGFNAPVSIWAKSQLKELMYFQSTSGLMQPIFNIERIKSMWDDHISGRADYGLKLFGLSVLGGWLEKNKRLEN
jgi:asparagine synthase (glutamine-hydrolysing)